MAVPHTLFCWECHQHFTAELGSQPRPVLCPQGHELGSWHSEPIKRTCRLCGFEFTGDRRVRSDARRPNGAPIGVNSWHGESPFQHFARVHPEVLAGLTRPKGEEPNP